MAKLTVVGGGQMGQALVDGLLASSWATPDELLVVESDMRVGDALASRTGVGVRASVGDSGEAASVVIAVKPGDVQRVCAALAGTDVRRVLSIAAGVRIQALEGWLGANGQHNPAVIRAMPNTPALVGAGASALAAGSVASEDDVAWASAVLAAVGSVTVVPESALDAVTGLSGSGPAYVFLLAEALIDAGVLAGLARPVAQELAVQTVMGAGRLLTETRSSPAELRAAVTSPGGTTAVGLQALEAAGLRAAVADAVVAAAARSRELGA